MGQKVSPIGFRTGITKDWLSRWYVGSKKAYGECLVEDQKVRKFIETRLNQQPPYAGIARVEIERTREEVKIVVHTARPGLVIGPRGSEVEKLRANLEDLTGRKVNVEVAEIRNADVDAQLVADGMAEQLRRRASFRRLMKQRCESAMQSGAKGIKIIIAGRLGGSEMARRETQSLGSIPLHTLQANIDYGYAISRTTYGVIGVRTWIYKGRYGEEVEMESKGGRFGRRGRR